ncbi:MAG: IclR family transcriptional regulator [Acidimicrobiales bacterium]
MGTVQSVDRALLLLTEIGREPGGLVDLSQRVNLATSTTGRLLGTLESAGAIVRDNASCYHIGPLVHSMVSAPEPTASLEAIVHPHLVELSELLDEAACLAIASGDDTITVDQVDAPKPIQAENWTGTRVPMHAGGAGAVVMATWDDADVERYLAGDLTRCSANTVTDPDQLWVRIHDARARSVMWSHGEYVDGLSSCSAAVIDGTGRALGALYVYGPSFRYPADGDADRIAAVVLDRAERISAELGWSRRRSGEMTVRSS